MLKLINYEPPTKSVWQGRKDSLVGERFFQHVQVHNLNLKDLKSNYQKRIILVGFCSDEGIRRNEGRIGAKSGPLQLRTQLAKLAFPSNKQFLDVGNIFSDQNLELAQEQLASLIRYSHQQGYKTLAFGGGHEIAWAHFQGLISNYPKLGIINFDSHFDLRPLKEGFYGTSGTPFRQMADYCLQNRRDFDYCCLGIQMKANTKSLFDCAEELNVSYLSIDQMNRKSLSEQFEFLDHFIKKQEYLYLSLCLDVFAECFSPGVSAPQSLGLTPWQALPLLKYILQTGKVVSLDVAELSPPLDEGNKTARLAANLVAEMLDNF